jgi:hypothetical protein
VNSAEVAARTTKRYYDFYARWASNPVDVDAQLPGRAARIAQRIARFGEGVQPGTGMRAGDNPWLGQSLSRFEISPAPASLTIDQSTLLHVVDPQSGYVPGLVTGTLVGVDQPPATSVRVAHNGVLVTSAVLYEDTGGQWRYTALLPEAGFTSGHNVVELYFVDAQRPGHLLLAGSSGRSVFSLEPGPSAEVVQFGEGDSSMALVPGAVHGYVDTSTTLDHSLKVSGWVIDPQAREAVKEVLVFANGRGVYRGPHNRLPRADILKHHAVPNAGFSVVLPRDLLRDGEPLEIRVIGVTADGVAAELGYIERFEWRPRGESPPDV